ncbi:Uncharacterised protein [Actinomyces bovis]|uniref:Uridine kinase n=1 Tax=Actinomyces bovis TaxID=1658 RepID=A0ABY1VJW0_9ACTO|nr:AAA family ATPase [Actinomyces bovis]SPT52398.1 Uncharacterised protein [Actinomyces bovis]VEG54004.1 Uncharacterised protein [Actinomyces israelii]
MNPAAVTPNSGGSEAWLALRPVPKQHALQVVLAHLANARARAAESALPGRGLVVVIDGPAGAGKTHLAKEVAAALEYSTTWQGIVQLDELVPGWDGLAAGVEAARGMLHALDSGQPARARKWDWSASSPGGWLTLPPLQGGVLLLEGCGALASAAQDLRRLALLRVWVQAPPEICVARIQLRDPYVWDLKNWQAQAERQAQSWKHGPRAYWPDLVIAG